MVQEPLAGIQDLPVELILHIHLLSLSPALPLLTRHFHSIFASSSLHHRARFLLLRHDRKTLSHAVKYPICTLPVVRTLEHLNAKGGKGRKKLKCPLLPKRILRGLGGAKGGEGKVDMDLITYLLSHYHASANSHDGYPLARAVFARHVPLIRLLLRYGADPGLKDGWAVTTAIGNGDGELVRMLLEREEPGREDGGGEEEEEEGGEGEMVDGKGLGKGKKRRRESGGGGGKRRKMEDRCKATKGMLETAIKEKQWRIVEYLTAKGAPPSIEALAML